MAKTIVAGVDSSQTALSAAMKAAELAEGLGGEVHLCTAYSTTSADALDSIRTRNTGVASTAAYRTLTDGLAKASQQVAESVAAVLRESYPSLAVEATSGEGPPADVLLRTARKVDADIIVVGNKHVQGFKRILGSVARKVASEATCDLYIANTTQNATQR